MKPLHLKENKNSPLTTTTYTSSSSFANEPDDSIKIFSSDEDDNGDTDEEEEEENNNTNNNRLLPMIGLISRYSFSPQPSFSDPHLQPQTQPQLQPQKIQKREVPTLKFLLMIFLYITTGILQPLLIDTLRLHNLLGRSVLLLPTLANTTGMALCGLLASSVQWNTFRSSFSFSSHLQKRILTTAIIDLASGMALTYGLMHTGGSIFVILYNSCPAWTALLSFWLLKKRLRVVQFGGVLLVCGGLIVNVLGSKWDIEESVDHLGEERAGRVGGVVGHKGGVVGKQHHHQQHQQQHQGEEEGESLATGEKVVMGSLIVLVGSILHSLMFVLSERSMSANGSSISSGGGGGKNMTDSSNNNNNNNNAKNNPGVVVPPQIWSCCLGTIEASFMTLWVLLHVLMGGFYNEQDDSTHAPPPNNNNNDPSSSSLLDPSESPLNGFIILLLIDTIHASSFFALLRDLGSVGSALLKGTQMVTVVTISAFFFCTTEPTQCFTWWKSCSVVLVITGTLLYALGSSTKNKRLMKLKRKKKLCGYNKNVGRRIRMFGGCGDVEDEGSMIPMMDLETATTVVGRRPARYG